MKRLYILGVAILSIAFAPTSAVLASPIGSISDNPLQESESKFEIPNVKVIEHEGDIGIFSVLLDQTVSFNGQGSADFTYKSDGEDETVRVYVKNTSTKTVNYKLISPTGFVWVEWSLDGGEDVTTEHVFGPAQEGEWELEFDTDDGSRASVQIKVRDGL